MKEKAIGTIVAAMILISMLSTNFVASADENYSINEPLNMDSNLSNVNETVHPALQNRWDVWEKNFKSSSWNDKININETNEWRKYAFFDGNTTRLVIGINQTNSSSLEEIEKLVKEENCEIVNTVSIQNQIIAVVVETPITSLSAFTTKIRQANLASYIEPNMKFQTQLVPNDPYWTLQWGPQKIQADWAWNTTVGSSSILVAVIDTGIDWDHPDLAPNYVPLGYDWVNNDPNPMDDNGHGTHCAGIIAAVLNNGVGIAGLAQVRVMAEKGLEWSGMGYEDWLANAIIHAVDQGADIISMSWGGYFHSELIYQAIRYAHNSGVLLVAAAGNDGMNMQLFPAAYDEVIAVVATDQYDGRPWWTNYGDWVELAAPGVEIFSTVWDNAYTYMSGTSMACPHVAGLAALIWSRCPNKSRDWVRLSLRFSADDLGDPGFDIYYGYGRINAKKAVEHAFLEHELLILDWATPPYLKPNTSGIINATILNFGNNPESNVTIEFFANNTLIGCASISSLESDATITVSCLWTPTLQGTYNLTVYLVPVPGESIIENNVVWKYIYVGYALKAVVLDSAGTDIGLIIATWQTLNNNWQLFGDKMIYIDYSSLNKEGITYGDIVATGADVLIISCAYDPLAGWQFTDSEIEAIKRYTLEGHGLIVTAGTFYYYAPNNNKLAPLFGLKENISWGVTSTDLLHLEEPNHQLFFNVPNPFIFPVVGTSIPSDGVWDANELIDGKYVARGHFMESAIVVRRGLVYISPWLEIIPAYYHHHLQLLYNAITWSRYQKPQHDLAVSLDAPKVLKPGKSAMLNATVSNVGVCNETNVGLQLLINGLIVNSTTIPELRADDSYTITYLWTPTLEGLYNITAYALPVPQEEIIVNNVESLRVSVSAILIALFQNYDPWDYPANQEALDRYNVPYVVFDSSDFGKVDLSTFSKVVIASDQDQSFYNGMSVYRWWFEDYVTNGGVLEIHAADWGWHGGKWISFLPGGLQWISYGSQYVTVVDPTHPLLTTPNMITEAELDEWNYAVHGYFDTYPANAHIVIIEDSTRMPAYLEFEYGSGSIIASSQTLEWAYKWRYSRILENSLLYMPMKREHDLSVTLSAPTFIGRSQPVLLNATVRNKGLRDESDVELYLLINNQIVNFTVIPNLGVGESCTISYVWISIIGGTNYNVTAYAPPVPGEDFTENNCKTKFVYVSIYSRTYVSHQWVGRGTPKGWHGDDSCWNYVLPFNFPFYNSVYQSIYISSNGLITFLQPDTSYSNSISALSSKLAIAPAWDDWVTYEPYDIYIWQNSTHVGIRWYVRHLGTDAIANFEAILCVNGRIQFNYAYNDGPISATIGISNGAGDILAEEASSLNYINSIIFTPFRHDVAVYDVTAFPNRVNVGQHVNINVTVANEGDTPENFTVRVYYENLTSSITSLLSVPNEPHQANAMWIEPSFKDLTYYAVGQRFNVTVWLNLTETSYVWQICLVYNGTILNATRCKYTAGSQSQFFQGLPTLAVDPFFRRDPWGNASVMFGETLLGEAERGPGYGSLCWIEFEILNKPQGLYAGSLVLDPEDTFVCEPENLDFIQITLYNGTYGFGVSPPTPPPPSLGLIGEQTVYLLPGENMTLAFVWNTTEMLHGNYTIKAFAVPVPLETDLDDNVFVDGVVELLGRHDVAVISIKSYRPWVYQSLTLAFNVTIRNEGGLVENVTVTLYYNITSGGIIAQQTVFSLRPGENKTVTLMWNTTGIAPCRNYTITATATIPYPDRNPADNTLSDGAVKVRILGDIDGDGKVDMKDVGNAGKAFGETSERPRWNPDIDINGDGKIDMYDIAIVAKHFGECA